MLISILSFNSFYRFVLNEEPQFGSNGDYSVAPLAKFSGLPTSPLFTLAMITPENWLVEVVKSPYDLDNIHLEQVIVKLYKSYAKGISFEKLYSFSISLHSES